MKHSPTAASSNDALPTDALPAAALPVLDVNQSAGPNMPPANSRMADSQMAEDANRYGNTLRGGPTDLDPVSGRPQPLMAAPGAEPYAAAPSMSGYPAPQSAGSANSATMAAPANAVAADRRYDGSLEVDPSHIYNAPGDPRLDGIQSPGIVIQKRAPTEVKVGQAAPVRRPGAKTSAPPKLWMSRFTTASPPECEWSTRPRLRCNKVIC